MLPDQTAHAAWFLHLPGIHLQVRGIPVILDELPGQPAMVICSHRADTRSLPSSPQDREDPAFFRQGHVPPLSNPGRQW